MQLNTRNERIDALRFVFCIMIIVYQSNKFWGQSVYFAKGWYIGFEFFFLLSGYFLMCSIESVNKRGVELNIWLILKDMAKNIYGCFFLSSLAGMAGTIIAKCAAGCHLPRMIQDIVNSAGNFFLLEMTGIILGGGYKAGRLLGLICPDAFNSRYFNFL
ncbi:MAG: hypothetical protein HFE84_12525 [Lachnospiraceae bacterium]|nr:hypothetical protein [Lachnospiraceae bacterium]